MPLLARISWKKEIYSKSFWKNKRLHSLSITRISLQKRLIDCQRSTSRIQNSSGIISKMQNWKMTVSKEARSRWI